MHFSFLPLATEEHLPLHGHPLRLLMIFICCKLIKFRLKLQEFKEFQDVKELFFTSVGGQQL